MAVIGTAQVVIRAITTGLQKDIEGGLKKGIADAKVDKAGEDAGEQMAKGVGRGVRRHAKDIDGPLNEALVRSGRTAGDRFVNALFSRFSDDSEIQKRTKDFSKKLTKSLTSIFKGINIPPIAWLGILAVPALGGAVKLISNYIIGIVGQLGFLTTAAVGAGAAIGTALVGLGTAILPLFLLLKRNTPELDAFKAQMKDIGKTFEDLSRSLQRVVLPAVSEFVGLMSDRFLPILGPLTVRSAASVTNFLKLAAAVLTSGENFKSLSVFAESSSRLFDTLLRIVARLLDTLIPLLEAAAPLAEAFALSVEDLVKNFQEFIRESSRSGRLQETLRIWYDRAVLVGTALGDIAVAIFNVLKIGGDASTPFFDRLSEITQKWRDFTESVTGQNQIKQVFDNALPVMHEVNLLIRDIIKAVIEPTLKGNTGNLISFLETLRTVVLPVIIDLAGSLSAGLGDALLGFTESLAKFLDEAGRSGVLFTFFTVLGQLLDILSALLQLPGVSKLVASLFAVSAGLKALNIVTLGFSSKALGATLSFLLRLTGITPALAAMGPAFTAAGGGMAGFQAALAPLAAALAPIAITLAVIAAAVAAFVIVWKNWDTIKKTLGPIGTAFLAFLSPIVALVAVIKEWRDIMEFVKRVPGIFLDVVSKVPGALAALPGIIADAFAALPGLAGDALDALGRALVDGLSALGPIALRALVSLGSFLIRGLVTGLTTAVPAVVSFFTGLPARILAIGATIVTQLIPLGLRMMLGLAMGLFNGVVAVITFFRETLLQKILESLVNVGTWLVGLGVQLFVGFVQGVVQGAEALWAFLVGVAPQVLSFLAGLPSLLVSVGAALLQGLVNGAITGLTALRDFLTGLPGNILSWLASLADLLLDLGGKLIGSLRRGIATGLVDLGVLIRGLPDKIVGWIGDLAELLKDAGEAAIHGFIDGAKAVWEKTGKSFFTGITKILPTLKGPLDRDRKLLKPAGQAIIQGFVDAAQSEWIKSRSWFQTIGSDVNTAIAVAPSAGSRATVAAVATRNGSASVAVAPAAATGAGSLVHIEHAQFVEPTDLDAFLGTVRFAYNMAGGR